jgi:hypothetical protein
MAQKRQQKEAQQTEDVAEALVVSQMVAAFLRDCEEFDCDAHRTIEDTPDGPLIALDDLALWEFQGWACLKYGATQGAFDVQETTKLILHRPDRPAPVWLLRPARGRQHAWR